MHRLSKCSIIFTVASLVAGLGLQPQSAFAQTIPSPYKFIERGREVSVYGGVVSTSGGGLRIGPNSGNLIGGRFGVNMGSALAFEVNSYLLSGERDVKDPRRAEELQVVGNSDINIAGVDAQFRINLTGQRSWHSLQPFVMLGAGLAWTTSDDRTTEIAADIPMEDWFQFGSKFSPVFGTGVTLHASEKWIFRLDATMRLWKVDTPSGFPPSETVGDSEWVGNKLLTVGTGIRF